MRRILRFALLSLLLIAGPDAFAQPAELQETPALEAEVAAGRLPPVERRIPEQPLTVTYEAPAEAGRHGGELRRHGGSRPYGT